MKKYSLNFDSETALPIMMDIHAGNQNGKWQKEICRLKNIFHWI